jgi:hypothetical protein
LAIAAAVAWTALLGAAEARIQIAWGDQAYFLTQLRTGLVFHQPIYRGFEFAYGPALYLWPAAFIKALAPFGISASAAYLASLATMQAAGLCLLFWTVQALPLGRSVKTAAFLFLAIGTFTALLGLNYSVFRFILPFASIVLLSRQQSPFAAAAVAGLGEIAQLSVSPELGVAFGAAAIAYAIYRAIHAGTRWIAIAAAPLIGALLFVVMIGRDYFLTIGRMARGGYNLLILPEPHILALLAATVALAPIAIARSLRQHNADPVQAGMILATYIAALGLLPAALGRCDPIHIFFDGIGMWLLALVTLNSAKRRTQIVAIAAIVCVFTLMQARNVSLYRHRLQQLRGAAHTDPLEGIDEGKLFAAIGNAKVSVPLPAPHQIVDDLTQRGQFVPGFYCGWDGVWDAQAEQRVIADMRRTPLALVPLTDPVSLNAEDQRRIALAMRLGLARHAAHEPYARGTLMAAELNSNWTPIGISGGYILFRRLQ